MCVNKNGKLKKIEEFKCGDNLISYNLNTKKFEESTIDNILLYEANTLIIIKFDDKSVDIVCTPTHPFWCDNKQMYCCLDNNMANKMYNDKNNIDDETFFGKLCVGDKLLNDKLKLSCISSIHIKYINDQDYVSVRTFSLNNKNHNFFANGKLVHNK